MHPWWPKWLCVNELMFWILLGSFIIGGLVSWIITKPEKPWLIFYWVTVTYEDNHPPHRLHLDGEYEIVRECPELLRARAIWRAQAINSEGEVVTYVPGGSQPPLTVGVHRYSRTMEVSSLPEGWRVLFVVICPGETPETVPSQLVAVTKRVPQGGRTDGP